MPIHWTESNLCTGAQHQYGQTYSQELPKCPRNDRNSIPISLILKSIHEALYLLNRVLYNLLQDVYIIKKQRFYDIASSWACGVASLWFLTSSLLNITHPLWVGVRTNLLCMAHQTFPPIEGLASETMSSIYQCYH